MAEGLRKKKGGQEGAADLDEIKHKLAYSLLSDSSFTDKLIECISSTIVDTLLKTESFMSTLSSEAASKLGKTLQFKQELKAEIVDDIKENVTQNVYQGIQFDHGNLADEINNLKHKMSLLEGENQTLREELDCLEQYGQRNCLLIHGLPEKSTGSVEDTDEAVINVIQEKLNVELSRNDIDRSHRLIRQRSSTLAKPRPIIVKFARYNKRSEVFRMKKHLKGSGVSISESLTSKRQALLRAADSHPETSTAWSMDGRIIGLLHNGKKIVLEKQKDINKLQSQR